MKQTSSLQRQQHKRRPAVSASVSFAEPTRPFASATPPSSLPLPHERQERPEHTVQFKHSLGRIAIRPPESEREAGYEVEPSGMQQIGAESSPTVPRERPEHRERTTQFKHSLDRIAIRPPVTDRDAGYKGESSGVQQIGAELSPTLPHERPERPERITQFKHSLDRISIHPPVPDRDTGYKGEPSGMQQIGAESSSVQREETGEQAESQEGEALQRVAAPSQAPQNRTGLPDTLKAGVESLSGLSLDKVRVHYHSAKPAQVNALAYTQGTEIHVGSGQEQHLAHEAWHVVQQMQGRVRPTLQTKGVAINDDQGLEREAEVMGARAVSEQLAGKKNAVQLRSDNSRKKESPILTPFIVQRFGVQVDPDDPEDQHLVNLIMGYRENHGFLEGQHNVAVAFLDVDPWFIIDHSHGWRHSEVHLDRRLAAAGLRGNVLRIHSEREPCSGPASCERMIRANYITPGILHENNVTYWFGYGLFRRLKERRALKDFVRWQVENRSLARP